MNPKTPPAVVLVAVLAAAASLVPAPSAAATPPAPTAYRVSLPVLFTIDAVTKTITPTKIPGELQSLDGAGQVIATSAVPSTITTAVSANTPTGSSPNLPGCSPSQSSGGYVTVYPPYHVASPPNDSYQMDYTFQTIQYDNARLQGSGSGSWYRQFLQCTAGSGQALKWYQTENGAGVTMEDPTPVMLGHSWGEWRQDTGSSSTVGATVNTTPVSVTGSTTQPVGGGVYTGSVGNNPNTGYLSAYPYNQVNGWWKADSSWTGFGGVGTGDSRGNPNTALWEYPMTDTHQYSNIRGQTWLTFSEGPTVTQAAASRSGGFVGRLSVWGDNTGYASGSEVVVTGNDTWNGPGAGHQTVNATVAKAIKYTTGTTCGTQRGCFKVKTGVSGSNSLNPTASDIWYDVNTIPVGYTSHTTWGGDPNHVCTDWLLGGTSGVKNAGSVKVHTDGTITAATNGTQGSGASVTVSSGVAGPFYVTTNESTPTSNAHESAVCLSDASATNGNMAPLTLL